MQFYTEEGMTIAGVIVLVALAGYDGIPSSRYYWVLKQSAFIAEIEPTHVLTL